MSKPTFFNRMCRTFKHAAMAAGVLCVTTTIADASPIGNASFGIGGAFTLPSGANLGNTNSIFISNGGMIVVTAPDNEDLTGIINLGMTGTLKDLPSISGFTPIGGYLSVGGVTVDLNSLTLVSQSGPTPGYVNLSGNVTIDAPGYDPTSGVLTFTGTSSDNHTFTLAVTTSASSASTTSNGVPEPMSLALLGLGLIGLFAMAHRRGTLRALPTA